MAGLAQSRRMAVLLRESCELRTLRGGSADYPSESWSRVTSRLANAPTSIAALVGFRVVREIPATDTSYIPVDAFPAKGKPIASGGDPQRAFSADPALFWLSPEKGSGVKGNAWIGIAFDIPGLPKRIELEQPTDPMYQQDGVLVQSSQDGTHWMTVTTANTTQTKPVAVMLLPETATPAPYWCLLADSDNQLAKNQPWAVTKIRFYVSSSLSAH